MWPRRRRVGRRRAALAPPQAAVVGGPRRLNDTLILAAIVTLTDPYPPTIGELAAHLTVAKSTVQHRLEDLSRRGLVVWIRGRARTLRVVSPLCQAPEAAEGPETEFLGV